MGIVDLNGSTYFTSLGGDIKGTFLKGPIGRNKVVFSLAAKEQQASRENLISSFLHTQELELSLGRDREDKVSASLIRDQRWTKNKSASLQFNSNFFYPTANDTILT